jgi:polyisoprenoid-binding protein YceI
MMTLFAFTGSDLTFVTMTRLRLAFSLLSMLALSTGTASAEPQPYTIDEAGSRIVIHVGKTGVFGFAGHEHEVVAPLHRGALVVDPAHVEASSADLSFDARALRVTGRGEPPKDVPKVQETMSGPTCLDAGRFPEIRFVSKAVTVTRPAPLEVTVRGTLTLHGVSREIAVPVRVDLRSDLLDAQGTVALKQSDFGMKPVSVGGVVKVEDEVKIALRLVAHRAP